MSAHSPGPVALDEEPPTAEPLEPLLLELPPVAELLVEDGAPPFDGSLVALLVVASEPPLALVELAVVELLVPPAPDWSLVFASLLPQPLSAAKKPKQQTEALAVRILVRVKFPFRVLIVLSLVIKQIGARANPGAPNLLRWLLILAHREKLSLPKAAYFGLLIVVSFRSPGGSITRLRSRAETRRLR